MFAAFPRFPVLRRFTQTAAFAALTFGAAVCVPSFSAQAAEKTPSSTQALEKTADAAESTKAPAPRRRVVLKAPLATLRKAPDAPSFSAPELNATAAPLDDAVNATDAVPTPSDATDAASRTLLGREI
ncbi:MAG: hypothetical protein IJ387_05060, partial [Thermoguttaceae bacterium]|nr:hypothetical protein [Thermoguttaceae bacterium]